MTVATSIEVRHRLVEGMHMFDSAQMPGFFVANRDPKRAYDAISTTLAKLVMLDTGVECTVAPEVSFAEFIGNFRADAVGDGVKRFTLLKEAA